MSTAAAPSVHITSCALGGHLLGRGSAVQQALKEKYPGATVTHGYGLPLQFSVQVDGVQKIGGCAGSCTILSMLTCCTSAEKVAETATKDVDAKSSSKAGFLSKLAEAQAKVNSCIVAPDAAKQFMEESPGCLLLDVQDPGSESIPGAYNVSLGTLFFKASTDLPEFKDPKIADLPSDWPIVITCALGGQATLAAAVLMDYGFTNIRVIDGGCTAWKEKGNDALPEIKERDVSGASDKKGFLAKLAEAKKVLGDSVLSPKDANTFIQTNTGCLVLDVQDPNAGSCILGAYNASLGTLFFKASQDLADFKDPKIADLPVDSPILVTCALGGQALLGGALLKEYGFSNVKVVDGGDAAWKKELGEGH